MNSDEEFVRCLAHEWGELSEQAQAIRERERVMRETLEQYFQSMVPYLNREFEEAGWGYRFDHVQHAGFMIDGPILFDLNSHTTEEWREQDEHDGWVDMERANKLTEFINNTQTMQKIRAVFPHIKITVEHNCISFDPPEDDVSRECFDPPKITRPQKSN